jgi:hypothetical protein
VKYSLALVFSVPLALACSDDAEDTAPGVGGSGGSAGSSASAGSGGGAGSSAMAGSSGASGNGGSGGSSPTGNAGDALDDGTMSFFVTSAGMGNGGDLGGLAGADAFCEQLAAAAVPALARRTWRAYLSTASENARERIGTGPWRNQAGTIIASDLTGLHDQAMGGALDATWPPANLTVPLDEQGNQVPNNVHDILTGTKADGTLDAGLTCQDWTSSVADAGNLVRVGHSNRQGGGQAPSWSTTHTVGCAQTGTPNITQGGGRGSFYCFAVITGS